MPIKYRLYEINPVEFLNSDDSTALPMAQKVLSGGHRFALVEKVDGARVTEDIAHRWIAAAMRHARRVVEAKGLGISSDTLHKAREATR